MSWFVFALNSAPSPVHFWTYERDFLSQYCQAWVRLELDTHLAQQALREALDTKEVQEARERLNHITELSHVRSWKQKQKAAENVKDKLVSLLQDSATYWSTSVAAAKSTSQLTHSLKNTLLSAFHIIHLFLFD